MKNYPLLSLVGICVGVLIFFPIIWGDRNDVLWQFVYNFQTLITGIFAILAALLTVRKMHEVDARQQARHDELIALSLRRDKLIVERALQPQVPELNRLSQRLAKEIIILRSIKDEDIRTYFMGRSWQSLTELVASISEVINRKQMDEIVPLLTPYGLVGYQEAISLCDVIMKIKIDVRKRLDNRMPIEVYWDNLKAVLEQGVEGINLFTATIKELSLTYSK